MRVYTCPNDGELMDSDAYSVRATKMSKHTCTTCGYNETR